MIRERKRKKGKEGTAMEESTNVEFKELDRAKGTLPASVPKEIVAFANTGGGVLYIGISDDGSIVGVENPDNVMTRLSNTAKNLILPDIMPFLQIETVEMEDRKVVKATVSVGTERPYYLQKEGLTPGGVFIRVGTACIPVNEDGIRRMIIDTYGKSYEECRSINQNLTFETFSRKMKENNLEFGEIQMKTLKMVGSDGLFSNLALLLSDQCPYTIKLAVFQGEDNTVFRDRREFTGSLLKQLEEILTFLEIYNKTEARFAGYVRTDYRDYPVDALREALLNAIVHRDYTISGSTLINIYSDHIDFISLGGLVKGISMEAIRLGASSSRNPNLAQVFLRLKYVESYGIGIRKIINLYSDSYEKPIFRTAEGAFLVELFNRNEEKDEGFWLHESCSVSIPQEEIRNFILNMAVKNGRLTRREVEETCGCGTTKAFRILKELCDEGKLTQHKSGNLTVYLPVKQQ